VIEEDRSCHVTVTSHPLHIIRSSSANKLRCGSTSKPWILEAPVGQQINVSLISFSSEILNTRNQQRPTNCQQYSGYVLDKSSKQNVSICGNGPQRSEAVLKSSSNVVEVILNSADEKESENEYGTYLLRFTCIYNIQYLINYTKYTNNPSRFLLIQSLQVFTVLMVKVKIK